MVLEESVSFRDAACGQLLGLWETAPTPMHTHASQYPRMYRQHYVGLVGLRERERKLMK